jgi:methionyl-tRNA formyltransferase
MDQTDKPAGKAYRDLRIVFMGTPEFAVASLDALVQSGAQVVGVITAPDKPAGRGLKLQESAVKKYAAEKGLTLLQPEKLKNPEFLEQLRALNADLQVVVAFRMLPEAVWNMPPLGTINVHGSLLPQYRGAAPINWAIINGETETGVTTFQLRHEIDTGDMLLQQRLPIGENETAGELHDRMKEAGAQLLVQTLQGLAAGNLQKRSQDAPTAQEQSNTLLRHAPKIVTDTGRIDWSRSAADVHNLIRGLSPFPGAFTELDGKMLKIYRGERENAQPSIPPGQVQTDRKTFLEFAAADGYIRVLELQLEGKKKMLVEDFLRGYRFA